MTDHKLAQIIWDYMRYEQPLKKADLIMGLGSDDIRITEWASKLYLDGYAPKVLFTGGMANETYAYFDEPEAEAFAKRAVELGVRREDILIEPTATNTGENITKSYELLQAHQLMPATMILVQKPFMLRRTYATFMKQWPSDPKPTVMTSAIDLSMDDYVDDERYGFTRTVHIMVGDLQRIHEYPKLGFQIEQDIPDEVWAAYEELVRRGYTDRLLS